MIYDEKYDIPIFEDEDILDAVDYSEKLKNALVTRFDKDNNTINTINDNIDGISNMVISINRTKADANSVYTKKESDNKYANAIKQELTKAKEAQINSTGANLQNVQFFGESVQETREGYNYFNTKRNVGTSTNTQVTIIDNNNIKAATTQEEKWKSTGFLIDNLEPNTDYFLKANIENSNSLITENYCVISNYTTGTQIKSGYDLKTGITFNTGNLEEGQSIQIAFSVTSATAAINTAIFSNIFLAKNVDKEKEYEDFGAMPSIDYPSPISSITNVDYKIIGKNMAPANVETKTISGVSVKNNNDGTYTLNGTTTGERSFGFYAKSEEQKVNLKEGKTYKLVVKEFSGSKTAGSVTSAVRKDTGELVYNYITQGSPVVTATYNSTVEFINLYVSGAGVVFDNYRLGIMLIEQGENEEFEAYKEKTTTITLPEETELCSLPNGVVDCVDSTGVIHKKIGKMVLDGTGTYGFFPNYPGEGYCYYYEDARFKIKKVTGIDYKHSLCTHFTNVYSVWAYDTSKIGTYSDHPTLPRKYFVSDKPTLEEFKAQLAELQPTLFFELAGDTTQNLAETEKAKMQNLETFEGINNITNNAPISAVYNTDTKSYIDSKFNTLAQQLLNMVGGN